MSWTDLGLILFWNGKENTEKIKRQRIPKGQSQIREYRRDNHKLENTEGAITNQRIPKGQSQIREYRRGNHKLENTEGAITN